jgi:gluconate 5-dehydrogenase
VSAASVTAQLFDVSGRRAVVTGAGSGLGLAIAEVLADCGARVTLAASPASSFMTGAVITIDGGQLLGEPGGW